MTLLRIFRRNNNQPPADDPATPVPVPDTPAAVVGRPPAADGPAPSRPAARRNGNGAAPHHDDASAEPRPRRRRRGSRGRGRQPAAEANTVATAPAPADTRPAAPAAARAAATGLPVPEAFRALGIDAEGLQAVAALGFEQPTAIQEQTVPLLLGGRDVVGIAETGSGKTIAFGLPLARTINGASRDVQAIVLVPTRELADQVTDVFAHLGRYYRFETVRLVGGKPLKKDFEALEAGAQVVVGTPGRVIDHLKRRTLDLKRVAFVVLDEADEMLDIGFAKDIDWILRSVPRRHQTALFSATMPIAISRLVWRYMRDSERVETHDTSLQRPAEMVRQLYCEVAERDKFKALRYLHGQQDLGRSLVFRRTKIGVDRLTAQLQRAGMHARAIHGDLHQRERDRVIRDFRAGDLQFLVATNVAARGLDIPDIEHVINFDVPQNVEEYIHRVGRTARAGKTGSAVTFVGEWELGEWDAIAEAVGQDQVESLPLPPHL